LRKNDKHIFFPSTSGGEISYDKKSRIDLYRMEILPEIFGKIDVQLAIFDKNICYTYFNESHRLHMQVFAKYDVEIGKFAYPYSNGQRHIDNISTCIKTQSILQSVINLMIGDDLRWYNIQYIPHGDYACCMMTDITSTVLGSTSHTTTYQYDFLRSLIHQLRSPLNGIIGMSHLIESDPADSSNREYSQAIIQSGTMLLQLVNDIINLDTTSTHTHTYKLDDIIGDCISILQVGIVSKKMSIERNRTDIVLSVSEIDVQQILINFIDNAIKYSPYESTIRINSIVQPDHVIVEVTDQGGGVPEDILPYIFNEAIGSKFGLRRVQIIADKIEAQVGYTRSLQESTFWLKCPHFVLPRN
jgi:hypothetical protein